jgi:hypothetical protein
MHFHNFSQINLAIKELKDTTTENVLPAQLRISTSNILVMLCTYFLDQGMRKHTGLEILEEHL